MAEPIPALNRETLARFMAKVVVAQVLPPESPLGPCWFWIAADNGKGYGYFAIKHGLARLAHRVSYWVFKGVIQDPLVPDHLCRVRRCVNPSHLEAVPMSLNLRRGAQSALRTHCPEGHSFTGDNLMIEPSTGHRRCRACRKEANRKYRQGAGLIPVLKY